MSSWLSGIMRPVMHCGMLCTSTPTPTSTSSTTTTSPTTTTTRSPWP